MAASPPTSLQLAPPFGGANGDGPGCLSWRAQLGKVPFSLSGQDLAWRSHLSTSYGRGYA